MTLFCETEMWICPDCSHLNSDYGWSCSQCGYTCKARVVRTVK